MPCGHMHSFVDRGTLEVDPTTALSMLPLCSIKGALKWCIVLGEIARRPHRSQHVSSRSKVSGAC